MQIGVVLVGNQSFGNQLKACAQINLNGKVGTGALALGYPVIRRVALVGPVGVIQLAVAVNIDIGRR